jgi:parallel beta-helix repeat protein
MAIRLNGCTAVGNGGDGFHIKGKPDIELVNCTASGNGGQGFHVEPAAPKTLPSAKAVIENAIGGLISGGIVKAFCK